MKLIRASFENFRILKDLEVEFSTDLKRNVTVIRAANESGKTTMLIALQWALFGDVVISKKYRLHPLDAPTEKETSVETSVTVDYEIAGKTNARKYRLTRSSVVAIDGTNWERLGPSNVSLFKLLPTGSDPVEHAEAHIRPHLPGELREVFFTDGDRALRFIEGARGKQIERIEAAIRSLLGLNVVEDSIKHVSQVGKDLNKRIKRESGSALDRQKVSERIEKIQDKLPDLERAYKHVEAEKISLGDLEKEDDSKLREALSSGNKEELAKELEKIRKEWKRSEKDSNQANDDHADLFKSDLLGRQLLAPALSKAGDILNNLHSEGKIPNQAIPILEERLSQPTCICGESLSETDPDSQKRRQHITELIEQSLEADALQERVTALFYSSKGLLSSVEGEGWTGEYSDVFGRRQRANTRLKDLGEQERAVEAKIKILPDIDIRQLRKSRDHYRKKKDECLQKAVKLKGELNNLREELKTEDRKLQDLLFSDKKGLKLLAELEVSIDIERVLIAALETLKTRELTRVSELTNEIFLDMIGVEDDQRAIIKKAMITEDFRIVVYGKNDHELDPSEDLNGASRRALTIAFILALTRISEVEAPNVIDTPLGMTTGYVRNAILRRAAQESAQLVLFLTHDEIHGCEEILDEYAGHVITMTNPALYPRVIANDQHINDVRVLMCSCNHRQSCKICKLQVKPKVEKR